MAVSATRSLDTAALRADFPFLEELVNGKPLAYLDSASSTQKPRQVLDRMRTFYEHEYANVHRGVYRLAERATEGYEARAPQGRRVRATRRPRARSSSRAAPRRRSTSSPTRGASRTSGPGDIVLITELEHHANFVPWQFIASKTGASFRHIPIDDSGELRLETLDEIAQRGPIKVVATGLVSNSLGTINPVERLAAWAHEQGAIMVVDAAQAAPHRPIDVQALGCDFLALSSHKLCGPSGVGRAVGPRGAARGDAAVQPGRRDDPLGRARQDDVQRDPVQVRGGDARDRRGSRLRRRDRLHLRDRAPCDRAARARAHGLRDGPARRARLGAALRAAAPSVGRGSSRSTSQASTRTTSRRSSTGRASPCAPGTTARSR